MTATAPLPVIRKRVRLHQAQSDFLHSGSPIKGFIGGRGAGKSHVGCLDLIVRAKRGRLYLVTAPTYTMLADATLRTFLALGRDLGVIRPGEVKVSAPPQVRLSTGATVIFRSTDDPDRLRGSNLSGALMDEGAGSSRGAYEVVTAALREGGERGWLSVCTTPRGMSNWTYDVFGRGPQPDVQTFHCPTTANVFLPPDFAHDVRLQYGTGLRAAQELDGRFVSVEGAEWDGSYFEDRIWFDPDGWPPHEEVVRSVLAIDGSKGVLKGDWQALVFVVLDKGARFWIDAEAVKLDPDQLKAKALELIERWQPSVTVVESNSAGYYLLDQLSKATVRGIRPAVVGRHHGGEQSKVARILTRLSSQWARGTIHVRKGSPGARMLIEQARDFPEGLHDDLLDALEMGLELLGELCRPKVERRVCYEVPR